MGENNTMIGKLFVKDLKTGEMFELDGLKAVEPDTMSDPEPEGHVLEQSVPDGINIHITGSQINKVSNIEIYFKEEK